MKRSTREIKEALKRDRAELSASLDALLGTEPRTPLPGVDGSSAKSGAPLWSLLAGVGAGFFLMRKPLWPLRVAGRLAGLAVPIVVPMLASYVRERYTQRGSVEHESL